ncbi:hypothetical protein FA09DRAFT_332525 [Tilletiopsis washingtonensis]|uniref:Uncharacterized protein n=1 Tax=Tilletiopsis washingtonensis TaxID=58919 RepID=A0A316Z027_9BASI|nr:hypothetical protein FA09DRAFT_332525 [Tilletiopsis washingtonensis]PWN94859.1 hypothetical protein FA09DRAFT_332525 [Tilletiopsis washingtonensis]
MSESCCYLCPWHAPLPGASTADPAPPRHSLFCVPPCHPSLTKIFFHQRPLITLP